MLINQSIDRVINCILRFMQDVYEENGMLWVSSVGLHITFTKLKGMSHLSKTVLNFAHAIALFRELFWFTALLR
jgi:hypothetical protein